MTLAGKTILSKKLFFWAEKRVFTSRNEELLEKYLRQWKKWFLLAENSLAKTQPILKKWFPHISVKVWARRKELSSKLDGFY